MLVKITVEWSSIATRWSSVTIGHSYVTTTNKPSVAEGNSFVATKCSYVVIEGLTIDGSYVVTNDPFCEKNLIFFTFDKTNR